MARSPDGRRGRRTDELPTAVDWSAVGGHHQLMPSEGGPGFETPLRLAQAAEADGSLFGRSRMPEDRALGPEASPNRVVSGGVGVRKGVLIQNAVRAGINALQRVRTAKARKGEAKAASAGLGRRLARLLKQVAPLDKRAAALKDIYETRRDEYLALPRMTRGYFGSHWPVIAVGVGVVVFDVGLLHSVLEYSGAGPLTVWLTSLSVPLAIGASNHGFGVLAGGIGGRVAAGQRLKLAAVLALSGLGALLGAFVLLTLFRAQAADSQNAALQALADGDRHVSLTFFVSPVWMGPLQIAGSLAAITMTAFWVMAKPGRDFSALILAPAYEQWQRAEGELAVLTQRIEDSHGEMEAAALVEHQIEADAHAAQVEVQANERILKAALGAEDQLERAIQARYETTEQYYDRIGENGGVVTVALSTVHPRRGQPYTPGPVDVDVDDRFAAEPDAPRPPRGRRRRSARPAADPTPATAGGNGHRDHAVDPDQPSPL